MLLKGRIRLTISIMLLDRESNPKCTVVDDWSALAVAERVDSFDFLVLDLSLRPPFVVSEADVLVLLLLFWLVGRSFDPFSFRPRGDNFCFQKIISYLKSFLYNGLGIMVCTNFYIQLSFERLIKISWNLHQL